MNDLSQQPKFVIDDTIATELANGRIINGKIAEIETNNNSLLYTITFDKPNGQGGMVIRRECDIRNRVSNLDLI